VEIPVPIWSNSLSGLSKNGTIVKIFLMLELPNIRPMRVSRRPKPFNHPDWILEIKFEGFRSLAYLDRRIWTTSFGRIDKLLRVRGKQCPNHGGDHGSR